MFWPGARTKTIASFGGGEPIVPNALWQRSCKLLAEFITPWLGALLEINNAIHGACTPWKYGWPSGGPACCLHSDPARRGVVASCIAVGHRLQPGCVTHMCHNYKTAGTAIQ